MTTMAFDTYAFVKELCTAGFEERQAEALSVAIQKVQDTSLDALATKRDLKETELAFKQDLRETELAFKQDLRETELAFKRDLRETELSLQKEIMATKRDLKETELSLQKEIAVSVMAAKVEIIRWVVGMGIVLLGGMMAINRVFPPLVYHQPSAHLSHHSPGPEMRLPTAPRP